MLKLYKNRKQIFECKIEIEGTQYSTAKPRLVFRPENDNRNLFFEGILEQNTCKITVTPNLDIPKIGKVLLEVIIDDSTIFQPWTTSYEIVTEQAKVQSESVTLTFEPTIPTVKLVEEVSLKDDKNRIIEPGKPKVKVIESKKEAIELKSNKDGIFKENISDDARNIVNEFLGTVNGLNKIEKKALLEHISKTYKPNSNSIKWAKKIFVEQNSLATKISQYCYELENKKKI